MVARGQRDPILALGGAGVALVALLALLGTIDGGRWAFWGTSGEPNQELTLTLHRMQGLNAALAAMSARNWTRAEVEAWWRALEHAGEVTDGWGTPLDLSAAAPSGEQATYRIRSAGPDRELRTGDDVQSDVRRGPGRRGSGTQPTPNPPAAAFPL